MKQHRCPSGDTAHQTARHSGSRPAPANTADRGMWERVGRRFGEIWLKMQVLQLGPISVAGQGKSCWWFLCGGGRAGGGGMFLTAAGGEGSGNRSHSSDLFHSSYMSISQSSKIKAFLIWAPAARERTVPVGRHWLKHLLTAWDGVCVFWFGFLIIFLQSVHGLPSGTLWIVGCPRCNSELSYLSTWAALEALEMEDLCAITYVLWNNCLSLKYFDIDKWPK